MSTIPAFQSGLNGIQSGIRSLNENAAKIASADALETGAGITEPLINLLSDELQIKASAKVIEASNAAIGSILDIKA